MRLIDANELIDCIDQEITEDDNAYNDGLLRSINIINEQYSIPAVPIVKVWKKTTLTKEEIERAIGDASFCLYMQMMIEEEVERRIKKHESRNTKSIK